jgi:hypothetical protein
MAAKKEITLLSNVDNPNLLSKKIFNWLFYVVRYVLVFTELVVIIAFLSRFTLDPKNSDLSDSMRQKKAILAVYSDFENEYNLLNQKLKTISNLYQKQPLYSPYVLALSQSAPEDIVFQSLIIKNTTTEDITAQLSIYAYQENAIIDYISQLTINPQIKTVNVTNIEKKPREDKYSVDINITFNNQEKPSPKL